MRDSNRTHHKFRRNRDDHNLAIMLFNNRSSISKMKNISQNMWANDDKIMVLVNEPDETIEYSQEFVQAVTVLNQFVLIGPNSKMVAFRMFRRTVDIKAYTVDMFNIDSVVEYFNKVYGHHLLSLSGKEITVFLRYSPSWSLLCPKGQTNDLVYVGPDALVSELILSRLNATIKMTSDVGRDDNTFTTWFYSNNSLSDNIRFRRFHQEAITQTVITDFNARCVEL